MHFTYTGKQYGGLQEGPSAMDYIVRKKEWFQHIMIEREQFFDIGFTAVYIEAEKPLIIVFWKCLQEGEGPWLSSQES